MRYELNTKSKNPSDWRLLRYGELAGTKTEEPGSFDNAHLEFWQEIEKLRGEWTKSVDDLPPEGEKCWVVWQGVVQNPLYELDDGRWVCCDDADIETTTATEFTHWMRVNKPAAP